MFITTSYKARIIGMLDENNVQLPVKDGPMEETASLCREILGFCVNRIIESWDEISGFTGQERRNFVEHLFHGTACNKPKYPEFDRLYPKLPSYTRRNIISDALGKVSSWKSSVANWEAGGRKGNTPILGTDSRYQPTFYKDDRDVETGVKNQIRLRMFMNGDWKFLTVVLKPSDMNYIRRMMRTRRLLSPSIQTIRGRYYVKFSFRENVRLVDENPLDHRILAVDLGLNNAASMCVMEANGTILGRKVFSLPREKDRLDHALEATKRAQQTGYTDQRRWRKVRYLNRDISLKTASAIMEMAERYNVDCIVFEHLDPSGHKKGRHKQRIHHWKCREVQNIVTLRAHRDGMRVSHVCAWNTSRLAFDGSGPVSRGRYRVNGSTRYNYSICVFQSGKQYHCDLSASYNIGARYFLRAYQNAYGDVPVPATRRTLSTLWEYVKQKNQQPVVA